MTGLGTLFFVGLYLTIGIVVACLCNLSRAAEDGSMSPMVFVIITLVVPPLVMLTVGVLSVVGIFTAVANAILSCRRRAP